MVVAAVAELQAEVAAWQARGWGPCAGRAGGGPTSASAATRAGGLGTPGTYLDGGKRGVNNQREVGGAMRGERRDKTRSPEPCRVR